MSLSGMGCYGKDGDHSSLRTVIPEDPVGAWCFLLGICRKNLFSVRTLEGSKFMRVQGWVSEIGFKKPQTFSDGFENIPLRRIVFKLSQVGIGLKGEKQFVHRPLFGVFGKRSALDGPLLRKPGEDFL